MSEVKDYAWEKVVKHLGREYGVASHQVERVGEGDLDPLGEWRGSILVEEVLFLVNWRSGRLAVESVESKGFEVLDKDGLKSYLGWD